MVGSYAYKPNVTNYDTTYSLKKLHPDKSMPFVPDMEEVSLAFESRQVPKLVEVMSNEKIPETDVCRALQLLLDISSNQEKKASAVDAGLVSVLASLMKKDSVDIKHYTCKLLQSIAMLFQGRESLREVGCYDLLRDLTGANEEWSVRQAAADCVRQVLASPDGLSGMSEVPDIVQSLVSYVSDASKEDVTICLPGLKALSSLVTREPALLQSLENDLLTVTNGVVLKSVAKQELCVVGCALLSHLCHHPAGKLKALEAECIPLLTKMLGSPFNPVRQRAAGALAAICIEQKAKLATMQQSGLAMARLVRDPDQIVASNVVAAIENACELPEAREILGQILHDEDKFLLRQYVCWPKVPSNQKVDICPFPSEEASDI